MSIHLFLLSDHWISLTVKGPQVASCFYWSAASWSVDWRSHAYALAVRKTRETLIGEPGMRNDVSSACFHARAEEREKLLVEEEEEESQELQRGVRRWLDRDQDRGRGLRDL